MNATAREIKEEWKKAKIKNYPTLIFNECHLLCIRNTYNLYIPTQSWRHTTLRHGLHDSNFKNVVHFIY